MRRLEARLTELEALSAVAAGSLLKEEKTAQEAAMHAIFDATRSGGIDISRELLERLDSGTETDADCVLVAAIPTCHMSTHKLLTMMVNLEDSI